MCVAVCVRVKGMVRVVGVPMGCAIACEECVRSRNGFEEREIVWREWQSKENSSKHKTTLLKEISKPYSSGKTAQKTKEKHKIKRPG